MSVETVTNLELFLGIRIATSDGMPNWQRVESIIGETAREIGILIVVFAPLEATFSEVSVSEARIATMVLIALSLIVGGIILETRK